MRFLIRFAVQEKVSVGCHRSHMERSWVAILAGLWFGGVWCGNKNIHVHLALAIKMIEIALASHVAGQEPETEIRGPAWRAAKTITQYKVIWPFGIGPL